MSCRWLAHGLFRNCIKVVHDFCFVHDFRLWLVDNFFTIFFYNLLMTYSGLLQDKFMAYSWFDQKFSKSSWIFFRNISFEQYLITTCSQFFQGLFSSFYWLVHNFSTTCYELFMTCSWLTLDLFTTCSCLAHLVLDLTQLIRRKKLRLNETKQQDY